MDVQHLAQHVDTVFVALPQAIDSVRVADTVHSIVREVGGEWATVASLVLGLASFAVAAALVYVTYRASHRMEGLQAANNTYQKQHAELQGEVNRMQVQHEEERRAAEDQRARAHQRAVDARLSGIAYALRRQVESWVIEAPADVASVVHVVDAWNSLAPDDKGTLGPDMMGLLPGAAVFGAVQWAAARGGRDAERAEERVQAIVAETAEASPDVAEAIRRSFVLFYRALGRLNRQAARMGQSPGDPVELTAAYHELERCVEALGPVVGPELQQADVAT